MGFFNQRSKGFLSILHQGWDFFRQTWGRTQPTSCHVQAFYVIFEIRDYFGVRGFMHVACLPVITFLSLLSYACFCSMCVGICVFIRMTSVLTHFQSAVPIGGDSVTVSWSTRVFLSVRALPCQRSFILMAGVMMWNVLHCCRTICLLTGSFIFSQQS